MVETMKTVSLILFLHALHIEATPLNHHLDYLDPILYLEHHQFPNGRYKYGYESRSAVAHQEHGSDGTAKGFYSYVDNQGKVHSVEYVADHDGYKVLGDSETSVYTPEVEAARKAHMDAVQRTRHVNNAFLLDAMKAQKGQPLQAASIKLNANILPTPTVHYYEKIWPLPPVKYKDLAIRVNGEDSYDPRAQNKNNFGEVGNTFSAIDASSLPATFPHSTSAGLYYPKVVASAANPGVSNKAVVSKSQRVASAMVAQKAFENAFNSFKMKYNLS